MVGLTAGAVVALIVSEPTALIAGVVAGVPAGVAGGIAALRTRE